MWMTDPISGDQNKRTSGPASGNRRFFSFRALLQIRFEPNVILEPVFDQIVLLRPGLPVFGGLAPQIRPGGAAAALGVVMSMLLSQFCYVSVKQPPPCRQDEG